MSTYLDDFMEKMSTVPNDVNRLLRLIRNLDKRAEQLQGILTPLQSKFLAQVREVREKKVELSLAMKTDYELILAKQKELVGYAREKKEIADQLNAQIAEYHDMLSTEMKSKAKDKPEEDLLKRKKQKIEAGKLGLGGRKEEFFYDPAEARYCYCGQASHGEMVMCENPFCEKEWFHISCIEEKNLPEKWFCLDCQRQREKSRNQITRSFFVLQKDKDA